MNEKGAIKPNLTDSENSMESLNHEKYFNFFEYAPIALYIEDFSKVQIFVEQEAQKRGIDIKTLLENHPEIVEQLQQMVVIKDVNETAVNLFKANSKADLLENLHKVFTEDSTKGFTKLVIGLLTGEKEIAVETINKTLTGETINILIKFNVDTQSGDTLEHVIVSIENITESIKIKNALTVSKKRYKESQKISKIASWFYDFKTNHLFWSNEIYNMLDIDSKKIKLSIDFYLTFVHQKDKKLVSDFSIRSFLKNPDQNLTYRIYTKKGTLKYVYEKRSTIVENGKIVRIIGACQDVTERIISEKKLNTTKKLLSNTLSNIHDGFVILDSKSNYLFVNNVAGKLLGKTESELIGKNIWTEFPEKEGDLFFDNYQDAFRTKKAISFENYFEPWDRWFESRIIPSNDTMLIFFHETTQQKKIENKIKVAYNIINKSTSVAVLVRNEWDFPIEFASENVENLFGYSSDELLSQKLKIYELVHPDDIKYMRGLFFDLIKEKLSAGFKTEPFRIITKNWEVKWVETSIDIIKNSKNKITHIQGIIEDVSSRVKKEEIENILYNISKAAINIDHLNDFGYFIKSELNKIIDTSNFYIALYNKENDSFHTPVMVDEMETIKEFSAKGTLTGYVVKTKKSILFSNETHAKLIEDGEVDLVGTDSKIWVGVPLKSQNKVFGAIVVQSYTNENAYTKNDVQLLEFVADQISNAIQRKNANNKLKEALAKAQESDRLKSAFLANMSHEIRTPMNGIIGFSELFLDPDLSYAERKNYAEIVIKSSKQLLSIVNDILDISKIEAGVVQLNYEKVTLNKMLNEIEAFYLPKSKKLNLSFSCKKGLPDYESCIEIDKTKLNQVITNLLSNAFKFTDHGSIEFGYDLVENELLFFVKDTGVGINEKLHNKIFDRFIQADEDFEKQNKGTGLGLAISKKFIELFKGKIWLTSSTKGTTIFFTIPYTRVNEPIVTSIVKNKNEINDVKNKITILVAEDEEYNLLYISELFTKTNYKLIEATNGEEALEIAKSNPNIDLILMDIKMPVMNGIDAMKAIKITLPNLPIIALSAFAMESDKEAALESGFDSYLSKPLDKKLLFKLINEFTQ